MKRDSFKKEHGILTLASLALLFAATILNAQTTDTFEKLTWGRWANKGSSIDFKHNPAEGKGAPGAAEMQFKAQHKAGVSGSFLKKLPVEEGKTYRIKISARNLTPDLEAQASIGVQAFKDDKHLHVITNGTRIALNNEWIELSTDFTASNNSNKIQILVSASSAPNAKVIFDDFSMEEIDISKEFKDDFSQLNWSNWKATGSKVKLGHTREDGHTAKGAAYLEIPADNPEGKSGCLLRSFPVESGKEYTLLVYAKAIGLPPNTDISLSIQGRQSKPTMRFLGTGVQGGKLKAGDCTEWKRIVFTYKIPTTGKWKDCDNILVTLGAGCNAPGKVLFDDFEFFLNEDED